MTSVAFITLHFDPHPRRPKEKRKKEKNDMVQLLMFFLYEVEMLRILFWRPMILGSKGTKRRDRYDEGRWLTRHRAVILELVRM